MAPLKNPPKNGKEDRHTSWKGIYRLGGCLSLFVIGATIFDLFLGIASGSDLTALPQTALEKFAQFQENLPLALYQLDFLNLVTTLLTVVTYYTLYLAHHADRQPYVLLAFLLYSLGALLFASSNAALPMLDLSRKYAATDSEYQRTLLAAAGEAYLARGSHGSYSAFLGFFLPSLAGVAMAYGMLRGTTFGKRTAYIGLAGNSLLLLYVVMVAFVPQVQTTAALVAAPGGILTLIWMSLFTYRLFQLE